MDVAEAANIICCLNDIESERLPVAPSFNNQGGAIASVALSGCAKGKSPVRAIRKCRMNSDMKNRGPANLDLWRWSRRTKSWKFSFVRIFDSYNHIQKHQYFKLPLNSNQYFSPLLFTTNDILFQTRIDNLFTSSSLYCIVGSIGSTYVVVEFLLRRRPTPLHFTRAGTQKTRIVRNARSYSCSLI